MEVLIEKKMMDIKSEPVEVLIMDDDENENNDHHLKHDHDAKGKRSRSNSTSSQPTELEPCEEFPILYGLLTAPKSFKPRNSEELALLPVTISPPSPTPPEMEAGINNGGRLLITSRVHVLDCRRERRNRHNSSDSMDEEEEADSQNLDSFSRDSSNSRSSSSFNSRRSPQIVDSSSCMSGSSTDRGQDENNSPAFIMCGGHSGEDEDDSSFHHSLVNSPGSSGSSSMGDDLLDDNIPTSTTSGFKRKASRLEHAIGNIVKRKGRVQKRSSNMNSSNNNNTVPISMAPSSPTVSTTCVDPPPPERGRSEILERILRSTTTTNTVNPEVSHHHHHYQQRSHSAQSPVRRNINNNNNNNESGAGQEEPYAKLRDLLTMPEEQLVKRRRLEYGLNENKGNNPQHHHHQRHQSPEPINLNRRREFSPPRNNILASLLQKGRAPYEPSSYHYQNGNNGARHHSPGLVSINKLSDNSGSLSNVHDERPYKCSLCDLRFKKLPLLNRHVKTHSHIKRYVCRFCSHAFKRSDNLLAHMRTSCKGIKEADAKFAGVGGGSPPSHRPAKSNRSIVGGGQIIPQLLSSPPSVSPMVSRSQLEEALLNLRHEQIQIPQRPEKCSSSPSPNLVSTTTGSPPPPSSAFRPTGTRRIPPPMDFQFRHSKLLEILSGSPVVSNVRFPDEIRQRGGGVEDEAEEQEMPLPLSLKVERRTSSPSSSPSSSSPNQSHLLRSHNQRILYSMMQNRNELPQGGEEGEDDEEFDDDEENDNMEPLNLGRPAISPVIPVQQPQPQVQSARSRDHPEIVSILSRQPKNVVMMGPDLRKFVGIDA